MTYEWAYSASVTLDEAGDAYQGQTLLSIGKLQVKLNTTNTTPGHFNNTSFSA